MVNGKTAFQNYSYRKLWVGVSMYQRVAFFYNGELTQSIKSAFHLTTVHAAMETPIFSMVIRTKEITHIFVVRYSSGKTVY